MLLHIPQLLTPEQVRWCRALMDRAPWVDGSVTAGHQSLLAKNNQQIPVDAPEARAMSEMMAQALKANSTFFSAALPLRILPPLFNRYGVGEYFGNHVDNSIRYVPDTQVAVRTDVSTTVFLSDPDEYDGGELVVDDTYGEHRVKLPAGDAVVYPSTSLHRVTEVTRGMRQASFLWTQSLIRSDAQRALLFDLDQSIIHFTEAMPNSPGLLNLTSCYHNLLRMWSET